VPNVTQSYQFKKTYLLDKPYYQECYAQSVDVSFSIKSYLKAFALLSISIALFTVNGISASIPWFIFFLALIDGASVYFQQPWWVYRQLLSKEANSEVSLTMSETGILSESIHLKHQIKWQEMTKLKQTELGFIIYHSTGKTYLSVKEWDEAAIAFLMTNTSPLMIDKSPK